jgi:hypothetical protein
VAPSITALVEIDGAGRQPKEEPQFRLAKTAMRVMNRVPSAEAEVDDGISGVAAPERSAANRILYNSDHTGSSISQGE